MIENPSSKENLLSNRIIGLAIDTHRKLGPGLLESTYKACLCHKLTNAGLYVEREKYVPIIFEGMTLEVGYRIDILVEKEVVLEIKNVSELNKNHLAQILTYLKLGDYRLGILLNFNVPVLKNGIRRVVNYK